MKMALVVVLSIWGTVALPAEARLVEKLGAHSWAMQEAQFDSLLARRKSELLRQETGLSLTQARAYGASEAMITLAVAKALGIVNSDLSLKQERVVVALADDNRASVDAFAGLLPLSVLNALEMSEVRYQPEVMRADLSRSMNWNLLMKEIAVLFAAALLYSEFRYQRGKFRFSRCQQKL